MKKPSVIIGKRQILLSCLTALLAGAVYINYAYADDLPVQGPAADAQPAYGDTEFVSLDLPEEEAAAPLEEAAQEVSADAGEDVFARARLERTAGRDEAVQTLQMVMGGGDITQEEAVTTALDAVELSALIESECNIESLIKSQGFDDCVVYLGKDSAKVLVRTDGLEPADAALIKDIILGEVPVSSENIRIFEVK